jgi:hypothetical protein
MTTMTGMIMSQALGTMAMAATMPPTPVGCRLRERITTTMVVHQTPTVRPRLRGTRNNKCNLWEIRQTRWPC